MPRMPDPDTRVLEAERSAAALFSALPSGSTPILTFGSVECPSGTVHVQPLGCCWEFGAGAITVIERFCLGSATEPIRVSWTCEPDSTRVANLIPPAGLESLNSSISDSGLWNVWHRDVTLLVFPTTIDINLVGDVRSALIPAGTWVAEIVFYPSGLRTYEPGNLSAAVAKSFSIFELLSECMDAARSRGLQCPVYFLGDSLEPRMVSYARRRLGFSAIDNGDLGATVFAPVELVMRLALDRPARSRRFTARAERASRIPSPGDEPAQGSIICRGR